MKCEKCWIELDTPAEEFLHRELHREPWEGLGNPGTLNALPYALMPRVARLMEDYHQFKCSGKLIIDQTDANLIWYDQFGRPISPPPDRAASEEPA